MVFPAHRADSESGRGALIGLIGRGRAPFPILLTILLAAVSVTTSMFCDVGSEPLIEIATELALGVMTAVFGWRVGAILLLGPLSAFFTHGWAMHDLEWMAECLLVFAITSTMAVLIDRYRMSQAHLRAMLRPMTDVILTLDRDGRYLAVAPTSRSLLVSPAESLIGRNIADILPAAVAEEMVRQVRAALASDTPVHYEYTLDLDGQTTAFSAMITPVSDDAVVWVARDVTTQKQAERIVREAELNREIERRRAAEDALVASKERYRSIVDQSSEIIYTISAHGVITSLNPAFETTLGWCGEQWIGRFFSDLLAPEERERGRQLLEPAQMASVPFTRTVLMARDGRRVTIETSLVPQTIGSQVVGFVGVARDVTERERAEEKIRRSEQQLAESERIAGLGSWVIEIDPQVVACSENFCRMFGMDVVREPIPIEAFVALLDEDEARAIEAAAAILEESEQHGWESTRTLGNGERRFSSWLVRAERDAQNRLVRLIGTVQDVTERNHVERRLRESEERFRIVARGANDVVWDWDIGHSPRTATVTYADGLTAFAGFEHEEIGNAIEWWEARIHPDDRERVTTSVRAAVHGTDQTWTEEYRFGTKSGQWVLVSDRAQIIRDASGRVVRMIGAITDITERKQLEEQLNQSRRVASLGRVAASIAHEVNNVLMSIQPNVELIARRAPKELTPTLDRVTRAVRRGKRITEQILSYTRSAPPRLETVDVPKFLEHWEEETRTLLGSGVTLRIDNRDEAFIKADPLQLAQVLTNLVINARDAMHGKGTITLVAERPSATRAAFTRLMTPGDFVHFAITDEGTGMTPEQLSQLFEPLYTTKTQGTGLGLAISYQLVSSHGGHIFAESEVGRGSTFHLFIPAATPAVASEQPHETAAAPSARRIVLVEDEEAVAFGVRSLLELDGVEVEHVDRGRKAVERIAHVNPDAVILDVGLPDVDGVSVYREIESRWPDMPVVFSSGHADASKIEAFLRKDNVAFLLKPYGYDALVETMTALLDRVA